MTRDDKLSVAAAIVCILIFSMASSLVLPTLTLRLEARGEPSSMIGVFGAILGISTIISSVTTPHLIRWLGAKKLLCMALITVTLCHSSYNFFPDSTLAWFAIYLIGAFAAGLVFVLSEVIITSFSSSAKRGFILGVYITGFSLGFAIGPIILTFVGIEGWAPFLIGIAFTISATIFIMFAPIGREATPSPRSTGFLRLFPLSPLPFVCGFAIGAAEVSLYDLLPVYARKIGYEVAGAVFLLTVYSIGTMLTQPLAGYISDRVGQIRTLVAMTVLSIIGALSMSSFLTDAVIWGGSWEMAQINWTSMTILGIWGGALLAMYTVGLSELAKDFPPPRLVGANALFAFAYGLGTLTGPLFTGLMMDINIHGISWALALFCVLPLVCLAYAKREVVFNLLARRATF